MKKNVYTTPKMSVHFLGVQNMLATSPGLTMTDDRSARSSAEIETNECDDRFTDIWGNDF